MMNTFFNYTLQNKNQLILNGRICVTAQKFLISSIRIPVIISIVLRIGTSADQGRATSSCFGRHEPDDGARREQQSTKAALHNNSIDHNIIVYCYVEFGVFFRHTGRTPLIWWDGHLQRSVINASSSKEQAQIQKSPA